MRVLAFVQRVGTFLFALTFVLAPVNVLAQCITLGTVVNCTGSTPSPGFGDGTQNGLTINVANGATVSGGGPNWLAALELGSNNVVNNFGSVVGDRHGIFSSGVNVENSGSITGLWYGIWNSSGNYSLTNSGYIYGYVGGAIFSPSGFSMTNIITNTALGHIAGQLYGMNGDGATINNFGVISGDYIALTGDGVTITNYGTITGGGDGIQIRTAAVAGGDITNRGLIFGGTNALNLRNPANAFTVFNSGSLVGNVLLGINRLQLENGGTISGNVFNNGIFAVNRSTDYRFDGLISGTGTFQNDGSGTTTLSNISTYTGATTVNAGTLSVTGDISSSSGVTVNTGGTLSGTGNLPAVLIQSGGALVPGNSAGTITVT